MIANNPVGNVEMLLWEYMNLAYAKKENSSTNLVGKMKQLLIVRKQPSEMVRGFTLLVAEGF